MPARRTAAAGALVCAVLAVAGCGSSSPGHASTRPGTTVPVSAGPSSSATAGSTRPATGTPTTSTRVSAADLAAVEQQLNTANGELQGSNAAIAGANVDTAKAQEGSAP